MRLTPEEIEARRFRLAPNGYECESVDRFLAEITEAVRTNAVGPVDTDEFTRVGQEIAIMLRAARDSAGAIRAEAEGLAASTRSRAEAEADDVRKAVEADLAEQRAATDRELSEIRVATERETTEMRSRVEAEMAESRRRAEADAEQLRVVAEREAAEIRTRAEDNAASVRALADDEVAQIRSAAGADADHARALLTDARSQAETVIREAERQAAAIIAAAADRGEARAAKISSRAERQADQIRRGERAAHQRLLAARADLQQAIDRLVGTGERPVLDLTMAPPHVRTGDIAGSSHPGQADSDADPSIDSPAGAVGSAGPAHPGGADRTAMEPAGQPGAFTAGAGSARTGTGPGAVRQRLGGPVGTGMSVGWRIDPAAVPAVEDLPVHDDGDRADPHDPDAQPDGETSATGEVERAPDRFRAAARAGRDVLRTASALIDRAAPLTGGPTHDPGTVVMPGSAGREAQAAPTNGGTERTDGSMSGSSGVADLASDAPPREGSASEWGRPGDDTGGDPLLRMVRAAVGRAAGQSARHAEAHVDDTDDTDDTDTDIDTDDTDIDIDADADADADADDIDDAMPAV